jgi:hypothetical protein
LGVLPEIGLCIGPENSTSNPGASGHGVGNGDVGIGFLGCPRLGKFGSLTPHQ